GTAGPVASSGTDAGAESSKDAPRWDLSEIYTSPDSDEFLQDWQRLKELIGEVEALASGPDGTGGDPGLGPAAGTRGARWGSGAESAAPAANGPDAPDGARAWLRKSLEVGNECANIAGTLGSYLYCLYSTDTTNSKIMAKLNALETLMVALAPA